MSEGELDKEVQGVEEPVVAAEEIVEPVESVAEEHVEVEVDPIEEEARSKGWRPPDEFNDPNKEAVDAGEFLRREPLFDKMNELSGHIKRLEKQVKNERKRGYEQALQDLSNKRKEAVEIGDVDTFNAIDDEYNRVREEMYQDEVSNYPEVPEPSQNVVDFKNRNSHWFNSDTAENKQMVEHAVSIENRILADNPNIPESTRLNMVEREIKSIYSDKFRNHRKTLASKVEAPSRSPVSAKPQVSMSGLTDVQKATIMELVGAEPGSKPEDFLHLFEE